MGINRLLLLRALVLVTLIVCVSACDSAPHDNPLDPLSGVPQMVTVSGRVTGTFPPFDGRPGVRVRLIPQGDLEGEPERVTTTRADGSFSAAGLAAGSYRVLAEGAGFGVAEQNVVVTAASREEVVLRLDALPIVTSATARTIRIQSSSSVTAPYSLEVTATVTDPDEQSEVVAAALVVDAFGIRADLTETLSTRDVSVFRATIGPSDLPEGGLEPLLGEFLHIEVVDRNGTVTRSEPFSLTRVIDPPPDLVFPASGAIVNPTALTLEWESRPLPFEFVFEVELWEFRSFGPVLLERVTLPSTDMSYLIQQTLSRGFYFWTVAYIDTEGNRSRSFEANFEVQL